MPAWVTTAKHHLKTKLKQKTEENYLLIKAPLTAKSDQTTKKNRIKQTAKSLRNSFRQSYFKMSHIMVGKPESQLCIFTLTPLFLE